MSYELPPGAYATATMRAPKVDLELRELRASVQALRASAVPGILTAQTLKRFCDVCDKLAAAIEKASA